MAQSTIKRLEADNMQQEADLRSARERIYALEVEAGDIANQFEPFVTDGHFSIDSRK